MPYFRLSDEFSDHPKVNAAGNAAVGLWVRCGAYSSRYLLDGSVPVGIAHQYGSRREVERLVATRLWVPSEGGFLMPDFLEFNYSADQVRAQRKSASERQRRFRHAASNGDVTP